MANGGSDGADALLTAIERERGLIVFLTGAGISLASGIPTFRGSDAGAIWARDVTAMATLDYYRSDPAGSWRWYRQRFLGVHAARPNPAHRALAAIERWQAGRLGDFLLVTQNIDTLHEQAGSTRVVKVHGSADRCRCADPGCRYGAVDSIALDEVDFGEFDRDPRTAAIPTCPSCGTPVRPHVLWFDEYVHQPRRLSMAHRRASGGPPAAPGLGRHVAGRGSNVVPAVRSCRIRCASFVDPAGRPPDAGRAIVEVRGRAEDLCPGSRRPSPGEQDADVRILSAECKVSSALSVRMRFSASC